MSHSGPAIRGPGAASMKRSGAGTALGRSLGLAAALSVLCTAPGGVASEAGEGGAALFQRECANCHGPQGWGGKDGEYPRLAGLPASYVQLQLEAFRDRKRLNKPMIPIFKAGRLRGDDIAAVAAHLAALPPPEPAQVGVPETQQYDRELGEELYINGCSLCHGLDGNGKPGTENPPVTRQYPAYLVKQLRDFRTGERWHEYAEALFQEAEPYELDAMLAYMLELNHLPGASAPGATDAPKPSPDSGSAD